MRPRFHLHPKNVVDVVLALTLALGVAGCGDDTTTASGTSGTPTAEPLVIAYSAWPGHFPLRVAEEKGFFEKAGANVRVRYFQDYLSTLDAVNTGKVDANGQSLNDTVLSVSTGAKLKVVVNTDFSNGADAIIADGSIPDVAALKGKKVAAEVGLTPQFLLNQGLASAGLAQGDLTFRGVATDAAAAGFASGQFDAVAVFAPYTLEALKRPGAKVLFDSADLRGAIPDHIVFNANTYAERPDDIQKFVNAWYATVAWIRKNPVEARAIMAKQAGLSVDDYAEIEKGVDILDPAEALNIFTDSAKTTSLPNTARKADAFLQEAELTKDAADLTGLFAPEFTRAYVDGVGK